MMLSALLLGLLGSFHCIGMCGPIAFMLPVDRSNSIAKIFQISAYHFGRILAYALIGLLFGLVGKGLYLFGFQQQLSIIIGLIMIAIVVVPQKYLRKYNFTQPIFKIVSKLKSALGAALKRKSPDTFLTIGFLNGFLPCGLVYIAVFGAIASLGALEGGLYMALFGIGTIPLMTSAIYLGNYLNERIRHRIRKAIPIFVGIMGVIFILRGMDLGIPFLSPKPMVEQVSSNYDCNLLDLEEN